MLISYDDETQVLPQSVFISQKLMGEQFEKPSRLKKFPHSPYLSYSQNLNGIIFPNGLYLKFPL